MDVVDTKLIPLSETAKKLTTDPEERKKLNDDYRYRAKKDGLTFTKSTTKCLHVDPEQFYDWVKQEFPHLIVNIPEEYRLTESQCVFTAQSALHAYAPAPKFSTLDEAKQIVQDQADEIRDLKNMIEDLKETHERALAEVKIKADKWDNWIKKKGRPRVK